MMKERLPPRVILGVFAILGLITVARTTFGYYATRAKLRECAEPWRLGTAGDDIRARLGTSACDGIERDTSGDTWRLEAPSVFFIHNWRVRLLMRDNAVIGIRYRTGDMSREERPAGAPLDQ